MTIKDSSNRRTGRPSHKSNLVENQNIDPKDLIPFLAYNNGLNMNRMLRENGEIWLKDFIKSLTPLEAASLYADPWFTLREKQIIPDNDGRVGTMALTSRGFGKNHMGSVWINNRAYRNKGPILIVGQKASDTNTTVVEHGKSSIIELAPPYFKPRYISSQRLLIWPNGCLGFIRAGDEPNDLRGQSTQTVLADELAKWHNLEESWSNIMFGLREGDDAQYLITTSPQPKPLIKELYKDPNCIKIRGTIYENAANLNPKAVEAMRLKYEGTELGKQELEGELIWSDERALWKIKTIEDFRMPVPENILSIVIGLDPSTGTGSRRNDEAGIVVCASAYINNEKHGFILEDCSLKGSPETWAKEVLKCLERYPRARIVAESNQGGEMIRTVLQGVGIPSLKIELKHHVRSKYDRAQPISMKAEQGLIHHTRRFDTLEDEMISYTGEANEKSPNRLDAAVMALHELLIDNYAPLIVTSMGI